MRLLAQTRNPYSLSWLWIPGSLVSLAPRNDRLRVFSLKHTQLLMSADQVFSISLTTGSGIGM